MRKLIAILLFTGATTASASFVPGPIQVNTSGGSVSSVGYATSGASVPVSVLNTVTVTGTVTATPGAPGTAFPGVDLSTGIKANQGNAGTIGWFIDQSTGIQANLAVQASGGAKTNVGYQTGGSSVPVSVIGTPTVSIINGLNAVTTSYVVNPTTSPIQIQLSGGALTSVGYQTGGASVPVSIAGTPSVSITNGLNSVTTSYVVNPTTSPIQIQISGGALASVGYQTAGASVPVSIAGTASVSITNGLNSVTTSYIVNPTTSSIQIQASGGALTSVGYQTGGASVPVSGNLADNGAAAATNRVGTTPSIYQTSYLNGTAATQGRNGALSQGTDGLLSGRLNFRRFVRRRLRRLPGQ